MSDHAPIVIGKLVPFRQGTTFEKLPSPQVFILVDGTNNMQIVITLLQVQGK